MEASVGSKGGERLREYGSEERISQEFPIHMDGKERICGDCIPGCDRPKIAICAVGNSAAHGEYGDGSREKDGAWFFRSRFFHGGAGLRGSLRLSIPACDVREGVVENLAGRGRGSEGARRGGKSEEAPTIRLESEEAAVAVRAAPPSTA